MNVQNLNICLAVINVLLFAGALTALVVGIKKKVVDPSKVDSVLHTAESAVETVKPLLGATPLAPVVNVVEEALRAAETGAKYAEQLYKNNSDVDRKAVATEYVANTMKTLGVEVTPRIAQMIDGAVEAAVLLLPDTKTAPTTTTLA